MQRIILFVAVALLIAAGSGRTVADPFPFGDPGSSIPSENAFPFGDSGSSIPSVDYPLYSAYQYYNGMGSCGAGYNAYPYGYISRGSVFYPWCNPFGQSAFLNNGGRRSCGWSYWNDGNRFDQESRVVYLGRGNEYNLFFPFNRYGDQNFDRYLDHRCNFTRGLFHDQAMRRQSGFFAGKSHGGALHDGHGHARCHHGGGHR